MDGGRAEDGRGRLIRPAGGGGRSKLPLELMNLCEQKERRRGARLHERRGEDC